MSTLASSRLGVSLGGGVYRNGLHVHETERPGHFPRGHRCAENTVTHRGPGAVARVGKQSKQCALTPLTHLSAVAATAALLPGAAEWQVHRALLPQARREVGSAMRVAQAGRREEAANPRHSSSARDSRCDVDRRDESRTAPSAHTHPRRAASARPDPALLQVRGGSQDRRPGRRVKD